MRIAVEIQSPDERERAADRRFDGQEHTAALTLAPGLNCAELTFQVEKSQAVDAGRPNLYEGEAAFGRRLREHLFRPARDRLFLLRRAQVPWITLNGKPIYLNGTLDQSFNPKGYFTLPTEQDVIDEVQRLRMLG